MKGFPRWAYAALALLALALLSGGAWFYRGQERELREQVENDLAAIARLKVKQIVDWRTERLGDAGVLMEGPFFIEGVGRWLADPRPDAAEKILASFHLLQVNYRYADVLLIGLDGRLRLSLSGAGEVHPEVVQGLPVALRERRPVLTDLHGGEGGQGPHLGVIAPLFTERGRGRSPIGAVVLVCDARRFLFPLIQSWPTPSRTAETLLVRRDGDDVLFLNDLRHRQGTALRLRIPLTRTDLPAARGALGKEGVMRGKDYRGVDVIAVLQRIPDSPWVMVSKVDTAEALAEWRTRSVFILGLILGVAALAGVGALVVWQRSQKAHYRALYQSEAALRESEERYGATLKSIGDGVIATDSQGRVELLNPVAERLTGWTDEEAHGRPITEVFRIVNEGTRAEVENPVTRVLQEGVVVGLANHTVLVGKDGAERPIADSGAPIRDERGSITGVVLVFQDQTAERAIRQALQQWADAFEHCAHGIALGDASNHIVACNPAFADLHGYSTEEIVGCTVGHLYPPFERENLRQRLSEAGRAGYVRYEAQRLRKDGSVFPAQMDLVDVRETDGRLLYRVATVQDITERRKAEESLWETNRELEGEHSPGRGNG